MRLHLLPILAGCLICSSYANSSAREVSVTSARDAAAGKKQESPQFADLKSALDAASWNSAEQGLLLAIGPDKVFHRQQYSPGGRVDDVDPLDPPVAGRGLRMAAIAHYFDRRIVHLSTLTVVVPNEMVVLNTHLEEPNPYAGLGIGENLQTLEATLSAGQWQLLGSPNGIGLGDLSERQQPLFLAALPANPVVNKTVFKRNAKGDLQLVPDGSSQTRLGGEEREQIRLRVDRTSTINLLDPAGKSPRYGVSPSGTTSERTYLQEQDYDPSLTDGVLFGQQVRLRHPNKMKVCQIDFALPALDAIVSLQTAKTVGDILSSIRAKSGIEIYADGRLTSFPVYLRGAERGVRVGDALQGLCLALSGAVRRVGPAGKKADIAYVLTEDIEGLGAQRAIIAAWAERGQRRKMALEKEQRDAIKAQDPLQYISAAKGDTLAPSPAVMRQIEKSWSATDSRSFWSEADVSITDLSPLQRQAVQQEAAAEEARQQNSSQPDTVGVNPSRVRVSLQLVLTYIVPGYGEAQSGVTFMNSGFIPASKRLAGAAVSSAIPLRSVRAPALLSRAGLAFAPKSSHETLAIMDLARDKGIHALWIQAADSSEGEAILADAIAAGKTRAIQVSALVRLMAAPDPAQMTPKSVPAESANVQPAYPADDAFADRLDLNLLGETGAAFAAQAASRTALDGPFPFPRPIGDILAPEAEDTIALEVERVNRIASMPGIAGIFLKETSEPGHGPGPENGYPTQVLGDPANDFGYTIASRLRFLRQAGYDPIDLPSTFSGMSTFQVRNSTAVPYFDTDSSGTLSGDGPQERIGADAIAAWRRQRSKDQTDFLQALHEKIHKLQPEVPIYIAAGASFMFQSGRNSYSLWKDDRTGGRGSAVADPTGIIKSYSFKSESTSALPEVLDIFDKNRATNSQSQVRGDGIPRARTVSVVLDFTGMPTADTIAILRPCLADAPH